MLITVFVDAVWLNRPELLLSLPELTWNTKLRPEGLVNPKPETATFQFQVLPLSLYMWAREAMYNLRIWDEGLGVWLYPFLNGFGVQEEEDGPYKILSWERQ